MRYHKILYPHGKIEAQTILWKFWFVDIARFGTNYSLNLSNRLFIGFGWRYTNRETIVLRVFCGRYEK